MDMHQRGTAETADHWFGTTSLRIHAKAYYVRCTDKKSYQARFVIGPSFDRERRTLSLSLRKNVCRSSILKTDPAGSSRTLTPTTLRQVRPHKTVIDISVAAYTL